MLWDGDCPVDTLSCVLSNLGGFLAFCSLCAVAIGTRPPMGGARFRIGSRARDAVAQLGMSPWSWRRTRPIRKGLLPPEAAGVTVGAI